MPSISLPLANFLYNTSSVALVTGAVAVLLGTIGTVWTGSVKERYSDERIASNEAETARANERAASLEKETAVARVEQERLKIRALELELHVKKIGPRQLSEQQKSAIASAALDENFKPLVTINFSIDPESGDFAEQIAAELIKGGWKVVPGAKMIGNVVRGLSVYDESGSVQRVFNKANIKFVEGHNRNDGTYISVGEKPAE